MLRVRIEKIGMPVPFPNSMNQGFELGLSICLKLRRSVAMWRRD